MFEKRFRREIDDISLTESEKIKILEKIRSAKHSENQRRVRNFSASFKWVVTSVACVLVAVCAVHITQIGAVKNITAPDQSNSISEQTAKAPDKTTYDSIYKLFKKLSKDTTSNGKKSLIDDTKSSLEISGTSELKNSFEDYSGTNNQVEGVDEADIVKTDGKYIYVLNGNDSYVRDVQIIRAENGRLYKASKIRVCESENTDVIDMYVKDGRLLIIKTLWESSENSANRKVGYRSVVTAVDIYNIKNPETPELMHTFSQSGNYTSSRMCNNVLYLFTDKSFWQTPQKEDLYSYIPMFKNDSNEFVISQDKICIFENTAVRRYLVASSINISNAERIDCQCVLGGGNNIYMNSSSAYIASDTENHDNTNAVINKTNIIKLNITDGKIMPAAQGSVNGAILNQFSMDEYNGTFRIVTTVERSSDSGSGTKILQSNSLYVLNKNLKQLGSIENLAEGESIYSVRFDCNIAYFVTFKQVDPLFAADISDPRSPKILSALKIPGFSEYLHKYKNNMLLGLGKNADESSGEAGNVKLSMFNVSDPKDVTEQNKKTVDCDYAGFEVSHKAVFVNAEKNLIGFFGYAKGSNNQGYYYIYSYSNRDGFYQIAKIKTSGILDTVRGIYIGNWFYICTDKSISSYALNNFSYNSSLQF